MRKQTKAHTTILGNLGIVLLLGGMLSACGGGSGASGNADSSVTPTPPITTPPVTTPPAGTNSLSIEILGLGSKSLTLSLGSQTQTITGTGGVTNFSFTGLVNGQNYTLAIVKQPPGLTCTLLSIYATVTIQGDTDFGRLPCSVSGNNVGGKVSFKGQAGWMPTGTIVVDANGNTYGTTIIGGQYGYGTVYKITPDDIMTVLYSFGATLTDGLMPMSGLIIDASGNLYGTTRFGGLNSAGTIFKIATNGTKSELVSFPANDLSYPAGGLLLDSAGNIYGTTSFGQGSLYKLTPSLSLTRLRGLGDIASYTPVGSLAMDSQGTIYGAAQQGGAYGDGVLYKLNSSGNLTVLHAFEDPAVKDDGAYPTGGVIYDGSDALYGITTYVGSNGCGTIFKWSISKNQYAKIHDLDCDAEGQSPLGSLSLDASHQLWGTASHGGYYNYGTIFSFTPDGQINFVYLLQDTDLGSTPVGNALSINNRIITTTFNGVNGNYGSFVDIRR